SDPPGCSLPPNKGDPSLRVWPLVGDLLHHPAVRLSLLWRASAGKSNGPFDTIISNVFTCLIDRIHKKDFRELLASVYASRKPDCRLPGSFLPPIRVPAASGRFSLSNICHPMLIPCISIFQSSTSG